MDDTTCHAEAHVKSPWTAPTRRTSRLALAGFGLWLLPECSAELARKVRRAAPALPIILAGSTPVTGFDCIGWPLASDELAAALRRCCARPAVPA